MTAVLIVWIERKMSSILFMCRLVDLGMTVKILRLGICIGLQHATELAVSARDEFIGVLRTHSAYESREELLFIANAWVVNNLGNKRVLILRRTLTQHVSVLLVESSCRLGHGFTVLLRRNRLLDAAIRIR